MRSLSPIHWIIVLVALAAFAIPVVGLTRARRRRRDGVYSKGGLIVAAVWTGLMVVSNVVAMVQGKGPSLVSLGFFLLGVYWVMVCRDANRVALSKAEAAPGETGELSAR
jgi:hypothetical protein